MRTMPFMHCVKRLGIKRVALTEGPFSSKTCNNSFDPLTAWVTTDGTTLQWTALSQDYPFPHST